MSKEDVYRWEALMVPVDLIQRLKWDRATGQRLKALRKGKHSRRSLEEALKEKGVKYTQHAIQQLEEGITGSIEMATLAQILKAIDSDLAALLPTVHMLVALPQ